MSSRIKITIPGKVFLLGEYAALSGLPTLIAAVGPRFSIESGSVASVFHPKSPAGMLLSRVQNSPKLEFTDPFDGAGGFGASTAQFALLYAALAANPEHRQDVDATSFNNATWSSAWKLYRELTRPETPKPGVMPPSGADLVAQWNGGLTLFDRAAMRVWDLNAELDLSSLMATLMVFSATGQEGRKVATHDHLSSLQDKNWIHPLEPILTRGIECARAGDHAGLGQAMTAYAEALNDLGLELPRAREDREALTAIDGVLGAKGAGAMLADALVVVVEPRARARVREVAASRGLKLVCDGIASQKGLA